MTDPGQTHSLATPFGFTVEKNDPCSEARTGQLTTGHGIIETPVFTAGEDEKLLGLFEGLRVADVSDGMDAVGLHNTGLMDPAIHPLSIIPIDISWKE